MGRRSGSLWPESARGRVMMAPPVDVTGLRPRLGDVEAPPKPRSSLSSVVEVESEPLGRARRSSSSSRAEPESEPWVGRSGVRRLPGLSPSPSPGSGEAELPMVPATGPDCLSASLCQVAQQSVRRRRRGLSIGKLMIGSYVGNVVRGPKPAQGS